LEYYNNNLKSEKNINNTDMLNGKFKCLDGLCDWESLLNLAEEVEENFQNENNELIENMSPIVSKACLNLSEWEKMTYYVEKMENTNSFMSFY
jgi:hypothetical protein